MFAGVTAMGFVVDRVRSSSSAAAPAGGGEGICGGNGTLHGLRLALCTPPFAFCVACFLVPVALEPFAPLGEPLGVTFVFAWPVLLWCGTGIAVVAWTFAGGDPVAALPRADAWAASWYLCNGFFFNSMMDVYAGLFQVS